MATFLSSILQQASLYEASYFNFLHESYLKFASTHGVHSKNCIFEEPFEYDHLQLVHSGGLFCVPDPSHRLVRVGLDLAAIPKSWIFMFLLKVPEGNTKPLYQNEANVQ